MTGPDLVREAVAELYGAAPHEFISRRGELAAQARAAGDAPAARQIAALRKPTQSAWVLNQLARADPDGITELTALGSDLRAAQRSLDGAAIRDLSARRRALVARLTRQALAAAGQQAPPAALRDEVTMTLAAALADPAVAAGLEAGALSRAARGDGFSSAAPSLTVVPPDGNGAPQEPAPDIAQPPGARDATAVKRTPASPARARRGSQPGVKKAGRARLTAVPEDAGVARGPRGARSSRDRAARQEREQRERRRQALADAEEAAAQAAQAARELTRAEQDLERRVTELQEQLADARQELAAIRPRARRARTRDRQARLALDHARP